MSISDFNDEIQGVICGYANNFESRMAYLLVFVVGSSQRGTGSARKLFEAQNRYCKSQGMKKIEFTTNVKNNAARRFYKKMQVPIRDDKCTDKVIAYELIL